MARQITRQTLRSRIHDREAQAEIDDALCGISDGERMRIEIEDRKWCEAQADFAYARDKQGAYDEDYDPYDDDDYFYLDEFEDGDGNTSIYADMGRPFNEVFPEWV